MKARTQGTWRRHLGLVLLLGLIGGCFAHRDPVPEVAAGAEGAVAAAGGGTDGLRPAGPLPPEPAGVLVSPAGRRVVRGAVDGLGYVLPLDVRRPPAPKIGAARPTPKGIAGRRKLARDLAKLSAFPEHRLGPDDGHTQNETSIAIDGDTLVVGWNQFTDSSAVMGVGRSIDRAQSWGWELFGGHTTMSDPAVKAGGGGRWYFGYIGAGGAGGSDYEVFVRRSVDDGATWQSPVAVTVNGTFDDKPYIDARGDEVLVGWADFSFSPAKVRAARSLDGGLTFGNDTVLANASVGGNGACPVIAADGTYYVFWRDSFQDFLWMSKSLDQGATWSPDASIVAMSPLPNPLPGESFRIVNLPSAAADPASGDLVVVWNDQLFGDPDILSIRSADGGMTWTAPVRVNDDAGTTDQFFPWVTIDGSGVVHVVWYDRRQNGSDIDVYLTHSTDGGVSYEANVRVTAASFSPILPWESGAADFIGDYNAVAAAAGQVYPAYQDSRSAIQDVYVAVVPLSASCTTDPDCDDGLFCNGAETCAGGLCQAGSDPCAGGGCDEAGDVCTSVCGDAVCDAGEDCDGCPADCPSFPLPAASCGNGLCEAGDGEDCVGCPADCAGVQGGKPSGRFCCGFGGTNPVGCSDSACTTGGFSCTETPQGSGGSTCCGDLVCESPEDGVNCAVDCGAPPQCGDETCDPGEDECSCAADCGQPLASEVPNQTCQDGIDNDCGGGTDCADSDCDGIDPACQNVDCSQFGDKASCNAEPGCRWDNRNKVCVPS